MRKKRGKRSTKMGWRRRRGRIRGEKRERGERIYIASVGMENVNQVKRGEIGTSTLLKGG